VSSNAAAVTYTTYCSTLLGATSLVALEPESQQGARVQNITGLPKPASTILCINNVRRQMQAIENTSQSGRRPISVIEFSMLSV
jgi:hypothetical protein